MKLNAIFSKTGDMRFISHLDLMRLFGRALRRAGLPVAITQGFSPHLKISISRALKLGVESESEELVVDMSERIPADIIRQSLNNKLPAGVRIKEIKEF
ncbi:MAG: TIGR03936 family radical SAM-associated protein [Candidatus Omnitrophota bacterium]|nr:TIGR03936 family radical SAM-associated protein [Candidatus Omnitrophota bacterium]